jgi:hypothetical protein
VELRIVDGTEERLMNILEKERLERLRQRVVDASISGHYNINNKEEKEDENYFIKLSIKEGMGVEELCQEVMHMLHEVRVVLDIMAVMDENSARA